MDPMTTAASFGTIVGLLSSFINERRNTEELEYNEFVEWLLNKRHATILKELESNERLSRSLKLLVNGNQSELIIKFEALENTLLTIASRIDGLALVADVIAPGHELSDQAFSILEQLDKSGGSRISFTSTFDGTTLDVWDGAEGRIELTEERFVEDDLDSLVNVGFLSPDFGSSGSAFWRLTRSGARFVDQLNSNEQSA